MLKALLGLPEIAQADASDALAVAVCHINSYALKQLTGGARPLSRKSGSWRDLKI
jgi:crossover junction endodeoxyribonuclease RuvC